MTAKEIFSKPGVLLFLGVLIGGALVWISSALTTKNWNLFLASTPNTGGGGTGSTGGGTGGSGGGTQTTRVFVRPGSTGTTTGDTRQSYINQILNRRTQLGLPALNANEMARLNNGTPTQLANVIAIDKRDANAKKAAGCSIFCCNWFTEACCRVDCYPGGSGV